MDPTSIAVKAICSSVLALQADEISNFLKYDSAVSCNDSNSTQVIRDVESAHNGLISEGNLCTAGVQKETSDGEKCGK